MPGADLPPLFSELPAELADFYDPAAPWELLGEPLDDLLAALPSSAIDGRLDPGAHLLGDRIVIAAGAWVHAGAVLEGPVFIGPDALVLPGAYLRGGVWLGAGAKVGANTEVKRAVFLPGARAPHLNYVGDSILGAGVNLGAGTILANFRHDGADIEIPMTAGGWPPAGASLARCSATASRPAATRCSTPAWWWAAPPASIPASSCAPASTPPGRSSSCGRNWCSSNAIDPLPEPLQQPSCGSLGAT